ncbi:hypothetical protein HIM_02331 [Hirsutella minnesotensis 3608]|nr:hypothetical protein HIM_02331 [Hirsutella minnesotensis 3608]
MASKHPLRRSCAFCRARKIKCSNETICEACRRQGADCIYDFEPPRPKTRTISQDSTRSDTPGHAAILGHRSRSSTSISNHDSPRSVPGDEAIPLEEIENVAQVLEQKFYENFSSEPGPRSNPWQERISSYHRSAQASSQGRPMASNESVAAKLAAKNIKYSSILSLLTHDLVGLVSDQFGALGCHHVEDGGARFFLSGMASDESQSMFDSAAPSGNPLSEYVTKQQTQLIDVWFSVHPLSFLVSKTLLLHELRDNTFDEILVAVMLADANFSIGDDVAVARGHVLLRWATAQLRNRPFFSGANQAQGSGSSTKVFSGISTAQALMLLGWNALCSFQIRRASCYIGLAGRIASEIKEQISSTTAPTASSRINGIDVFDVEKELVAYLYWTTYSLSLWAFVQMGHGHFSGLLPTSLTSIFLPVTEASSVIIQLDLVSENFSTLQKQKAVIRDMWPLAHISSVIAYILALYPQEGNMSDSPSTNFWQEAPLLALQRIQHGKPSQGIAPVCREINRVLMESIQILNRQVTEVSSRSLVLLVYHTMAIHFLFPILPAGQREEAIGADLLERFCASAAEILQIFDLVSEQPQDFLGVTPSLRSSFPDVFCLALDTCARAMSLIDTRKKMGILMVEAPMMHAYDSRLQALSQGLYVMSQDDFLSQSRSLRMIRKRLKACVRALNGSLPGSNSNSSGIPSPDMARGSRPHTPMDPFTPAHSPAVMMSRCDSRASISMMDLPPSSYVSPMDTTAPSSGCMTPLTTATTAITTPRSAPTSHPSLDTPASRSMPFTPMDEPHKSDWATTDELFHSVLDHTALGASSGDHYSMSDLIDMQSSWFPQMPGVMDFDMSGSMSGVQWPWPEIGGVDATTTTAATASDMESVLYYVENGHNKAHC